MALPTDDYRNLTGLQKAAIFILAVGEEHSTTLLEKMDDEEIRDLSKAMSSLGSVSAGVVEQLFIEFSESLGGAGGGGLVGTLPNTERLLMAALPEDRVQSIMEAMKGPAGRTMWDKLANVNEEILANFLKNEYPQTVAVVLSKLDPDHASKVIAELPEDFSMEVIMRMLRMESVQKEILDHVEKTLRSEFMSNLGQTAQRDNHEMMAEIFNNLDRATETRFISSLEEYNREAAERIKALMFTFDDMERVDPSGIQVLLRQVDNSELGLALKGANEEIKALFFDNMSERAGKMILEDMDAMGAVRMKDVEEAQAKIVTATKALADSGEIVISGSDEGSELVY